MVFKGEYEIIPRYTRSDNIIDTRFIPIISSIPLFITYVFFEFTNEYPLAIEDGLSLYSRPTTRVVDKPEGILNAYYLSFYKRRGSDRDILEGMEGGGYVIYSLD